ncbi:MAG: hypothetical protein SGI96_00955 [Bacteroidota bacterium]|nr:hypothetical protein [Bacteroidota bacterium]
MKYIFTSTLLSLCFVGSAQLYLTTAYSLAAPKQKMGENIGFIHSLHVGAQYFMSGKLNRLAIGIEFAPGTYASTQKMQTFNFGNNSSTKTMVTYNSNVLQSSFIGKYFLLRKKNILPYINAKAGFAAFYSNIYVADPADVDGCRALQQKNLINDNTFMAGYGGGLQLDWAIFNKKEKKRQGWIDFSVNTIRGGKIDYINTKKLIDPNNPPTTIDGKPLNVTFINASTQQIHEHQVAEVFNTPLRMLEFKINVIYGLSVFK